MHNIWCQYSAADNLPVVAMLQEDQQQRQYLQQGGGGGGEGSQPTADFLHPPFTPLHPHSSSAVPLLCRTTAFAAAVIQKFHIWLFDTCNEIHRKGHKYVKDVQLAALKQFPHCRDLTLRPPSSSLSSSKVGRAFPELRPKLKRFLQLLSAGRASLYKRATYQLFDSYHLIELHQFCGIMAASDDWNLFKLMQGQSSTIRQNYESANKWKLHECRTRDNPAPLSGANFGL